MVPMEAEDPDWNACLPAGMAIERPAAFSWVTRGKCSAPLSLSFLIHTMGIIRGLMPLG